MFLQSTNFSGNENRRIKPIHKHEMFKFRHLLIELPVAQFIVFDQFRSITQVKIISKT